MCDIDRRLYDFYIDRIDKEEMMKVDLEEYQEKKIEEGVCPYCENELDTSQCHGTCIECGFMYGCGD